MASRIDASCIGHCLLPAPTNDLINAIKTRIAEDWRGLHTMNVVPAEGDNPPWVNFEINADAMAKLVYGVIAKAAGAMKSEIEVPDGYVATPEGVL